MSTNNRIASISGTLSRTYSYDASGNVLSYSGVTATYNNHGRLKTLQQAGTTVTYVYNGLDQLVRQSGGAAGTVHYAYDEAGHVLGEYDSTGALIQETIWLGDTPVATLRPGASVGVFYVHTDHLNTPRRITRPSDNQLLWTWESDPFGMDTPNDNPAGLGAFQYNLRLPGQIYDSQAGLMQNRFRDYDAGTSRYVEADPLWSRAYMPEAALDHSYSLDIDPKIGRVRDKEVSGKSGTDLYLYAKANPLRFVDASGLQAVGPDEPPESDLGATGVLCKVAHPDSEEYACDKRCQCVLETKIVLCRMNTACETVERQKYYGCKLKCAGAFCPSRGQSYYASN